MNRIAIELDEVLFPFIKPMAKYYNKELPKHRYFHYHHGDILNVGDPECRKMVKDFFNSDKFDMIQPIEGSQPILRLLKPRFEKVYLVASRGKYMRDKTEEWVDFHFPGIFDDVIFAGSYLHRPELEKMDLCESLNIVFFCETKAPCEFRDLWHGVGRTLRNASVCSLRGPSAPSGCRVWV